MSTAEAVFEILVCAYAVGAYSTRKIEALYRDHVQLLLIPDGKEPPDHTTIARFRESLSSCRYLYAHGQEAYIRPDNHESRRTKKYRAQAGRAENMAYCEPGDCCLCRIGRIPAWIDTKTETAKDGTTREVSIYRCEDCEDRPRRAACCKAKDTQRQKEIVICREMADCRQPSPERITSDEGRLPQVNRSIQGESSFAQLRNNRGCRRFLMSGSGKVLTELCLPAMPQNIVKYIRKCNKNKRQAHYLSPKAFLKF